MNQVALSIAIGGLLFIAGYWLGLYKREKLTVDVFNAYVKEVRENVTLLLFIARLGYDIVREKDNELGITRIGGGMRNERN